MTRFGISPFEALLTATRHAGEFLHEPLGTIASGQLADLILVEGDPLARVEDVARIRRVVANGIVHDMPSLLAPFRGAHAGIAPSPVERLAGAGDSHFWHEAAYLETGRHACCAGHILAHDSETPDDSAVCGHLHIGRA
jgi:hypothetical protein